MIRALLQGALASLLLVGSFAAYVLFAYALKRPDGDPQAALELRQALEIYGRLVILRGLLPQLWLTLPLAALLERFVPALTRSRARRAGAVAIAAGVAGLLVASTLLRLQLPGAPRVVFSGPLNFAVTWLEMTAGVVAAVLVARALLRPSNRESLEHPLDA
jgi:hypothetical protein